MADTCPISSPSVKLLLGMKLMDQTAVSTFYKGAGCLENF